VRASAVENSLVLQTGEKYETRYKKVIVIEGEVSTEDLKKIKHMLINSVEAYESDLDDKSFERAIPSPENNIVIEGFTQWDEDALENFRKEKELSMSLEDILHIQNYFQTEDRDPKLTELIVLDTYWSDHCRHTTFTTKIDEVKIEGDEALV
jgi:phosphoribosylformylglycinamidine synthase